MKPASFTAEDVEAIRAAANLLLASCEDGSQRASAEREAEELRNLADRIETLLPPQPPETL